MYKKGQYIEVLKDRDYSMWDEDEQESYQEEIKVGSVGEFDHEEDEFVYIKFGGPDLFWFFDYEVKAADFPHMTIFRIVEWMDVNILHHHFYSVCQFLTSNFFENED